MKRRSFVAFVIGAVSWPLLARAQNRSAGDQSADETIGQVSTVDGGATVQRGNAAPAALKVSDEIYRNDILQTGTNASLGANAAAGSGEARVKLYPDADGRVGRIDVFDRQGGRLGSLTQGASAFAIRAGAGGRFAAVPVRISPQEAARDRGVVQRLFASHNAGRRMLIERRQLRRSNRGRRGSQRPNNPRQPGGPQQQNRGPGGRPNGNSGPPQRGGLREKLRRLNPFKKKEPVR
ncbi:MAG TPA: hypothetical protein VJR71_07370 [Pseudolabrys sp.]|nr:hypothetical protein [Pseudolabrys sp.]